MSTLLSPAMEAAVGATVRRRSSHPVTASDIRRWAIAARWPDPVPEGYLTADPAALVAPGDFNPFAWTCVEDSLDALDLDIGDAGWIEKVLDLDPPAVTNQLNGAIEDEYVAPIRVGDAISSHSTLSVYREREGRLGRMLFTTIADTWTNQDGEVVKRSSMVLIRH